MDQNLFFLYHYKLNLQRVQVYRKQKKFRYEISLELSKIYDINSTQQNTLNTHTTQRFAFVERKFQK